MNQQNPRLAVDLALDGYIHSSPADVLPALTAPAFWRSIDPELELRCYHDRGEEGMRWYVRGRSTGMAGTAEVWLEPHRDGTLPHLFLRGSFESSGWTGRRRARRLVRTAERRLRAALFEAKDRLEAAYPPRTAFQKSPEHQQDPADPADQQDQQDQADPSERSEATVPPPGPRPVDPDRNPSNG